jgi:DNA-binding transcriptional MerR regulator
MADRLTAKQFAEAACISVSTLDAYITRGYAPQPDEREGGRRYWYPSTFDEWIMSRPGQGTRNDLDV